MEPHTWHNQLCKLKFSNPTNIIYKANTIYKLGECKCVSTCHPPWQAGWSVAAFWPLLWVLLPLGKAPFSGWNVYLGSFILEMSGERRQGMQGWFWRGMLFALLLGSKPWCQTSKKLAKGWKFILKLLCCCGYSVRQRETNPSTGELWSVKVGRIQMSSCLWHSGECSLWAWRWHSHHHHHHKHVWDCEPAL